MKTNFLSGFWLDHGSLALFRIALGLVLLSALVSVAPEFGRLYTEQGSFPRSLMMNSAYTEYDEFFSIYFASSSSIWAFTVYGFTVVTTLLFTIGVKTRVVTPVLYLLWLSFVGRNTMVVFGFDRMAIAALFWAIFVPLDRMFALIPSSYAQKGREGDLRTTSFGTFCFIMQIAFIYIAAGLRKNGYAWLDGSAVKVALFQDTMVTTIGEWVRNQDLITNFLTYSTLIIEVGAPILLVIPSKNDLLRLLASSSLIALHIGIALMMDIAWFPYFSCAFLISTVPFRYLEKFCKLPLGISQISRGIDFCKMSLSVVENALLSLGPWCHANRNFFKLALQSSAFTISSIFLVFHVAGRTWSLPAQIRFEAYNWGLGQEWAFFAPNPSLMDERFVVKGTFADGSVYDLITGERRPLNTSKSGRRINGIRTEQWSTRVFRGRGDFARHFLSNLCISFSKNASSKEPALERIDVIGLSEMSREAGGELALNPESVWYWDCNP